ncbi:MAG: 3'-5' exonuclease [Hamadaea sp.]|nr:3'-5' exonuclease [Hamadaea sp.]
MVGFDLETTGVNVDTDRIVTASIVLINPAGPVDRPLVETTTLLANPGVPIPAAATAVHGITDHLVQEKGRPPAEVLERICVELTCAVEFTTPIVTMNGVYDLTLLDRECRRHSVEPIVDRTRGVLSPVVDVRVLDKHVDPYRKGGRKLTDLCATYGVRIDGAHDSGHDALAACRVAWRIAEKHPRLQIDLGQLHGQQIRWAAEQVASFAAYRRKQGQPLDDEDGTWPIKPWAGGR